MKSSRVFPFRRALPQPRLRLVCVPHAGGSASLYRRWTELAALAVEVCAVELPGRGARFGEPAISDMTALCDGLTTAIEPLLDGVRLALFGHSMGARVAFELARRFDRRVVHLFAAGSPAPGVALSYDVSSERRPTMELTDDEFKQRLRDFGGTPALILDDDQLMARALPILRADFVLIERYLAEPQARVSCPITVFAGIADPGTPPATIAAWQPRTTAAYRVVTVDAGHFFLESHRAQLISEIARDLSLSEAR